MKWKPCKIICAHQIIVQQRFVSLAVVTSSIKLTYLSCATNIFNKCTSVKVRYVGSNLSKCFGVKDVLALLECVYWELTPLYSCLRTLREQHRLQNCDIAGTTTTH